MRGCSLLLTHSNVPISSNHMHVTHNPLGMIGVLYTLLTYGMLHTYFTNLVADTYPSTISFYLTARSIPLIFRYIFLSLRLAVLTHAYHFKLSSVMISQDCCIASLGPRDSALRPVN